MTRTHPPVITEALWMPRSSGRSWTLADLRTHAAHRPSIARAKELVSAAMQCSDEEAFAHLARLSQRGNRKLWQVAQDIVRDYGHPGT